MTFNEKEIFLEFRRIILKEKKLAKEIVQLKDIVKIEDEAEKQAVISQVGLLKDSLRKENEKIPKIMDQLNLAQPLKKQEIFQAVKIEEPKRPSHFLADVGLSKNENFSGLEKEAVKRIWKKKKKVVEKKDKTPGWYIKNANRFFSDFSERLAKKEMFRNLKRDLTKSNLQLVTKTYLSISLFTILLSVIAAVIIFGFFLFFNIGPKLPIITLSSTPLLSRLVLVFWILFVIPIGTAIIMYVYPSLEKKSHENKINAELPFATIHMSAISGSMVDPTKIFNIIISTNEYPHISKEFTKLLNQINLYGHDLVSALRELSFNTASSKLSELLNGFSTTINSGGDLSIFFEKRAESLLFEYKIEREKQTKSAETFMDIYISLVIAAPMIFMLLLMMMKISGLGISLSTSMISLIMVIGVAIMNVGFLVFLQMKQPSK